MTAGGKFPFLLRRKEMLATIEEYPEGRQALHELIPDRCTEEAVMGTLFLYCGLTEEELASVMKDIRHTHTRLAGLSKQLKEVAREIQFVHPRFEAQGIHLHFAGFDELPSTLEKYAFCVDQLKQTGHRTLSRRSGRTANLVYLVSLIRNLTRKPHYKELAILIGALQATYRPKITATPTAQSIRRAVEHYRKTRGTFLLDATAKDHAEQLKASRRSRQAPTKPQN